MEGYSRKTIIGLSWMTGFRLISRIIAFGRIIILARLLIPSQFGIFGIASITLTLLEILTETGINVVLVQEKKDIGSYINDAWLVSILRGTLIAVFILITAPFIATFFNVREYLYILFFISIVPFVKGFINPSIVRFQKELQFNKEFYLRTSIFIFDSLVAVIITLITRSAIGLVAGLIAGAVLEVILSFVFIRPLPRINFNFQGIKKIVHRGKWITLYGIFNYAAKEGDSIVIGRILGASSLGIYQMGYKISTMPISEISDVSNRVTFPVYSKISDNLDRLKRGFTKAILLVSLTSIVIGAIIFFFPKPLFVFIFGSKWIETFTVLKPLALYGIVRSISNTTSSLLFSVGKQNKVAIITFVRFVVLAVTIIPLTTAYGIIGASISVLVSGIAEVPLVFYYTRSIFNSFKNQ